MNNKIRSVKKQQQIEVQKPKQGVNTHDYLKTKLNKDVVKVDKLICKLEKSIQNHNNELDDKKKALDACKAERMQLEILQKQVPF